MDQNIMNSQLPEPPEPIERIRYKQLVKETAEITNLKNSHVRQITDVFMDLFLNSIAEGRVVRLGEKGIFKVKSRNQWQINIKYVLPSLDN
jgi:nucleoid DNA-binding protein